MKKVVEVCCGSYYDALQASYGGASRIELNSALHMGGLTPSLATLLKVKEETDLEVICMVRPRGAGFCYSDEDFEVTEMLIHNRLGDFGVRGDFLHAYRFEAFGGE